MSVIPLLGMIASGAAAAEFGEVAVSLTAEHVGVAYAAEVLAKECGVAAHLGVATVAEQPAVRAGLVGDGIVADAKVPELAGLSDEGFGWTPDENGVALVAKAERGLMYGLLELADRLHNEEEIPPTHVSGPLVAIRGDWIDLPFYLGCDLYDGRWRWHQEIEGEADSWFHDREAWTKRFRLYARRRMNALMLHHPHPFPAFITYPDAPEAAYFDDETVARNAEILTWIIEEGRRYGVELYVLTWNEWVPRGYAEAHNIPQAGAGTAESAALNRYSYAEFFRRFPGLAGLVTMAGESPPGCVEFVRDNVVKPLAELPDPPHITFWTWCAYPEDVNAVLDGYPGETAIMHYLQYEQLFKPAIDPRVGRMSEACGGRPVVVMGGPGTATAQLYWAEPYVIRDILRDVPKQSVCGVYFSGLDSWQWVSNKWIGWEALARYWWDPFRDDEDAYWERRIADVLGDEAFGKPLLSAYTHATAIPMRILCLLHSQSDVFRPQYGLPLVLYLGMPTLSTYVFENHTHIDEQGRLAPRMGLTWPNPDWGERVYGIVEYAEAMRQEGALPKGTTPLDIANELDGHADAIAQAVEQMQPLEGRCSWGRPRFRTLLGVLTMNEMLARHTAAKIRAALAWQLWHTGGGRTEATLPGLDESVAYFERYAQVAERLYPRAYGTQRNVLTKPPPWTNLDLWQHYRFVPDYRFAEYAERFRRERDLIAAALAEGRHELPYELDLVPPLEGGAIAGINEEGPFGGFRLNHFPPKATATMEDGRLVCEHKGTGADFYFPFVTDVEQCPLGVGARYELIFRYEITRVGEEHPLKLSLGARTTEGGWRRDVGARYFSGPVGTTGEIRTQFVPEEFEDYYVYLSMNGDGAIVVEDVRLVRETAIGRMDG